MQVNPADIRFTQDSISLYFQSPHNHFSIREAVRKLSKNKMRPEDFPLIRVMSHGGCLWSEDNRRLWVFRLARCSSIAVKLVNRIHPRLENVLSDGHLHSMMQEEEFFPRVRDRGQKDHTFDQLFPLPGVCDRGHNIHTFDQLSPPVFSLQRPVDNALEKLPINIAQVSDTEKSGFSTMPPDSNIKYEEDNPEEHHRVRGNIFAIAMNIVNVGTNAICSCLWNCFSVARKAAAAIASKCF